jgi:phosphatidylglycerophosphate synthase
MFDARLRPIIDPPLHFAARLLVRAHISATMVTAIGLLVGLGAAAAIATGAYGAGLALILLNRLLDGLDGAVARQSRPTDLGGYFDIVADFVFYVSIPVGFAFASTANGMPALILVASFVLTGTSFLAFATIAAKRGLETSAHGRKSFFYSTGIAEGSETIVCFTVMCLWPHGFPMLAYGFAAVCGLTVIQRSMIAARMFAD